MKKENGVSSVLGSVFLIGLIAIAAAAGCIFAITTITAMAENAPLAMFETSEMKDMLYHSGGEQIDLTSVKIYYYNEDITDECRVSSYAGGYEERFGDHPNWNTGEVLVLHTKNQDESVNADYVSIVAVDGNSAYVVLKKGEAFTGDFGLQPVSNFWNVTIQYIDKETGNPIPGIDTKKWSVPKGNTGLLVGASNIKGYVLDESMSPSSVNCEDLARYCVDSTNDECLIIFYYDKVQTYNVTFDANGGDFDKTTPEIDNEKVVKVDAGQMVANQSAPYYDQNRLLYWADADGNPFDFDNTAINSDIRLYARWSYAITFDTDGGIWLDGNEHIEYTDEDGFINNLPENVEKPGYVFKGWEYNGEKVTLSTEFGEAATLKAIWEPCFSVTFNPNGGTWKSDLGNEYAGKSEPMPVWVENGKTVANQSSNVAYDANRLLYWYDTNTGTKYNFDTPVTSNLELTARWSYQITFNTNGGDWVGTDNTYQYTDENGRLTSLPMNAEKPGYILAGWLYNGQPITDVSKLPEFTSAASLTAYWLPAYTVTFDPNGGEWQTGDSAGTDDIVSVTVGGGQKVTKPATGSVTYDENRLLYWYDKKTGKEYKFDTTTVSSNIDLVACWSYKITFDTDGGSWTGTNYDALYTGGDGKLSLLPGADSITKSDYVFDGWEYNGVVYKNLADLPAFTSAATLKAHWTPAITVTFDPNDGRWSSGTNPTQTRSVTVASGSTVDEPASGAVTYNQNRFLYWYDKNTGNEYNFDTAVTSNVNLAARWSYKITFNTNGGYWSGTDNSALYTDENGRLTSLPMNAEKSGQVLKGWSYNGVVYKNLADLPEFTSAATLTAVWGGKTWKVIFHPCGNTWPGTKTGYSGTQRPIAVEVEGDDPTFRSAVAELTKFLGVYDKMKTGASAEVNYYNFYTPQPIQNSHWYEMNAIKQGTTNVWDPSPVWTGKECRSSVYHKSSVSSDDIDEYWGDGTRLSQLSHSGTYDIIVGAKTGYLPKTAFNEILDEGLITDSKYDQYEG